MIRQALMFAMAVCSLGVPVPAGADAVTDVHDLALRTARAAGAGGTAMRTLAIVDLAMFDASNAIERRYRPYRPQPEPPPAGADAATAAVAAGCAALNDLHASQRSATDAACAAMLAALPGGGTHAGSRAYGAAVGRALVQAREADGFGAPNRYRPFTTPGVYVPTVLPLGVDAATAKPFALAAPDQFRPGPPPALSSETWSRDYNEVKSLGALDSSARTAEQSATVLFWASVGPQQYLDSITALPPPPRDTGVSDRARFLAMLLMAMSDAGSALFDAKYAYNFWRPVTAIRNGDRDGNDATERDAGWTSFIEAPMHPEYPCAHCTTAAAIATVLASVYGESELAVPVTWKPAAGRAVAARSYPRVRDFVPEVADARVWGGIHYRNSTAAGIALGDAVGRWVVTTQLSPVAAR